MAVDPATARLIAQAIIRVTADEEARRKILVMILAPVIGLLLLIAFILYLITNPFSLLIGWLLPGEADIVGEFQKDYGYNQNIGIYDNDYVTGSGCSYEGIIFTNGSTEVIYYNQFDERWANTMYGTSGTIGEAGCGPTSMAMVVSTLTGREHDPVELAGWSAANGFRCEGNGSYHLLIPESARAYGLRAEGAGKKDGQKIVDALSSGKLVVVIMARGHFTSSGHFIVLRGVTSDGKILVADPASYNRSSQEWELSLIMNEAREGAGAGGPFWIIWR